MPSLQLRTNVDLADKKVEVMKVISAEVSRIMKKPEQYVMIAIDDKQQMLFGGTTDPCAHGDLFSIGALSMESNGAVTKAVADALEPFGLKDDRMYIFFHDVERANVGWSRKTFAG